MKAFIGILFITSISFAAVLSIRTSPDTIYVGSLITVTYLLSNLQEEEYPQFSDIIDQHDIYSKLDRILGEHSVNYTLQIWKAGLIIIPSISISINKHNHDILYLQSGDVELNVLSVIDENNLAIRDMKPMLEIKISNRYKLLLYVLLLIIGISLCAYLLKNNKKSRHKHYKDVLYKKSLLQETIRNLEKLQIPKNNTTQTTEEYYLKLSNICRTFIREAYFIRATEMTSDEIIRYFQSIDINNEIINAWSQANKMADRGKYSGQLLEVHQLNEDKVNFIQILSSFLRENSRVNV